MAASGDSQVVAVDTPIVKAAAYNEYMFGKASLNCSISFVTVSKLECEGSFFWRKAEIAAPKTSCHLARPLQNPVLKSMPASGHPSYYDATISKY